MEMVSGKLTVFFEDPFWVGVFERTIDSRLQVCRVVFGAEPTDRELHEYVLCRWKTLVFSEALIKTEVIKKCVNPKRQQRMVKKEVQTHGIGTKAQQALKHQMEQNNNNRKTLNRAKKEETAERLFAIKHNKQKEKHKGH